ncbi:MAG: hypothetical protein HRT72_00165, partial [Flavobacteriales bacterium]|nr:hypothetical protein [Flavobacteriales bacterium]
MRLFSKYFLLTIVLVAIYSCEKRVVEIVYSVNHTVLESPADSTDLSAINFYSSQVGYLGTSEGILFKSIDGGTSWADVELGSTQRIKKIEFISESKLLVLDASSLYKSMDGGSSWELIYSHDNGDVSAVDDDIYYVSSGNNIYRTEDGGVTWESQLSTTVITGYIGTIALISYVNLPPISGIHMVSDSKGAYLHGSESPMDDYQIMATS